MAKLKFGSPAWRKKYMKKNKGGAKRKTAKRKTAKRKTARKNKPNTYTKKGAKAKKTRLKEMIKSNPPSGWTKVKAFRVVRKNGRKVLEVKR